MNLKKTVTAAGFAAALGASLLVAAPANAAPAPAPAGDPPIECRSDSWVIGGVNQYITYSNCHTYPVNKRATLGDSIGPCLTVPPLTNFFVLHYRQMPDVYQPWSNSVLDC
ncbi:hypothetical protein [Micromonospora tarensis]|uniref:Secreted protein n=1 Tax=Micromonospora tarensis TaxID=2806100 RepID=A0ABS1YR21_9ACTN|nr:hypothetical protein [Micromonospora tarensis]MBM0279893.1 hypothetical protein [Micromonospora tarensis]